MKKPTEALSSRARKIMDWGLYVPRKRLPGEAEKRDLDVMHRETYNPKRDNQDGRCTRL